MGETAEQLARTCGPAALSNYKSLQERLQAIGAGAPM
jgi:hypothetical protein